MAKAPLIFAGLLSLLIALQLVPLPEGLWRALPGREHYAAASAAAGFDLGARPLSLTPDLTWNSLLALTVPIAVALGATRLSERQLERTVWMVLLIACLSAVVGLLQVSGGEKSGFYFYNMAHPGEAVGLFANRNHQAALLALCLPLLRVWTLLPHSRPASPQIRGWVAAGLGVYLLLSVLVTGSRTGGVLALVGLLAAVLVAPPSLSGSGAQASRLWTRLRLAAVVAVPLILVAVAFAFRRAAAIQRLLAPDALDGERRLIELPTLGRMLQSFWPVGSGFGSFDPMFRSFEPDSSLRPLFFNHAHNDYIELVLAGGLPALLLLLAFIGWWGVKSVAAIRPSAGRGTPVLLARAGATTILILALASITDYPLRTPLAALVGAIAVVWLARGPAVRSS